MNLGSTLHINALYLKRSDMAVINLPQRELNQDMITNPFTNRARLLIVH